MNVLLSFLTGAAITLAVQLVLQLWVIPHVETRKRREDRWERNVIDLGELLTTLVRRQAKEAYLEQSSYRFFQQRLEDVSGVDQEKLAQARQDQGTKAYQSTVAFHDLVHTRVEWLAGRIKSISDPKPQIIVDFDFAWRSYQVASLASFTPGYDRRTDSEFDAEWEKERESRNALVKQVRLLADLPHPPRAPLRRRFTKLRHDSWRWLRRRWQAVAAHLPRGASGL